MEEMNSDQIKEKDPNDPQLQAYLKEMLRQQEILEPLRQKSLAKIERKTNKKALAKIK